MKISPRSRRGSAGYTITEVMISMTIVTMVIGLGIGTYMFVIRSMYKDSERLATNAKLRYLIAQVSQKTLDATEFYIFRTYEALDGSVNVVDDVTDFTTTSHGVSIYHGDCLVLVTRVNLEADSAIRRFRIYYRTVKDPNKEGSIRYYESKDYTMNSTQTSLPALLNAVNLKANPNLTGSVELAHRSIGRPRNAAKTSFYPVFSSEYPTISKTNESVSLNLEIINGSKTNGLLSSSSFNYTISPRR